MHFDLANRYFRGIVSDSRSVQSGIFRSRQNRGQVDTFWKLTGSIRTMMGRRFIEGLFPCEGARFYCALE